MQMNSYHTTLTELIINTKQNLYKQDPEMYEMFYVCAQYGDFLEDTFLQKDIAQLAANCHFTTTGQKKPNLQVWKTFMGDGHVLEWINYENKLKLQMGRNQVANKLAKGEFTGTTESQAAKFLQDLAKYDDDKKDNNNAVVVMFLPPLAFDRPNGAQKEEE